MQSHCNDTRVSGGCEIRGSVTAGERIEGTWERDVTVRLNMSQLLRAPPPPPPPPPRAEKGCVASKKPNAAFELGLLLGLSN